jgi:hypothetical protein
VPCCGDAAKVSADPCRQLDHSIFREQIFQIRRREAAGEIVLRHSFGAGEQQVFHRQIFVNAFPMDAGTFANQPPFVSLRGSGLLQARIPVQIDRNGAAIDEPRDDFVSGEIHARQPHCIRDV